MAKKTGTLWTQPELDLLWRPLDMHPVKVIAGIDFDQTGQFYISEASVHELAALKLRLELLVNNLADEIFLRQHPDMTKPEKKNDT